MGKTRGLIERYGWAVLGVFPAKGEEGPCFSYTVGLSEKFDHPEIFLVGLPPEPATQILNMLGARIKDGERFVSPSFIEDFLNGYHAAIRPLTSQAAEDHGGLGRVNLRKVFPSVQLVYPDRNGVFPWQPGCNEVVAEQASMFEYADEPPTMEGPTNAG